MPKLKSSQKRLRTSLRARNRNRAIRSRLRTAIKRVRQAPDRAAAEEALKLAIPIIDRTAKKGVLHRNAAARHKSRLSQLVHHMA
ncbi:MAG: 30S ribosomal protein S20 [Candidatus Latescibacterota bacterium]